MKNRTHIITLAAFALTGAAALTGPAHAQIAGGAVTPPSADNAGATAGINSTTSGTLGVPNVTMPGDSVRQGAAGINSAQAEATRTTGDPVADAQARAENETARSGLPSANPTGTAPAVANDAARAANQAANRGAPVAGNPASTATDLAGRTEEQVTQQLNREQAANASASGNLSTR